MISTAYIDGVAVELVGDIVLERNRKEVADYGKITIVSTRSTRYEPNSVVDINDEQYIVQSDEPLLLKNLTYEHQINLGETMLRLEKIFPIINPPSNIQSIQAFSKSLTWFIPIDRFQSLMNTPNFASFALITASKFHFCPD